jgi:hypothetical protein
MVDAHPYFVEAACAVIPERVADVLQVRLHGVEDPRPPASASALLGGREDGSFWNAIGS